MFSVGRNTEDFRLRSLSGDIMQKSRRAKSLDSDLDRKVRAK